MSNIKEVHGKPRLNVCQPIIWSMAAMLRDSVAVVRTRPQAIPLAMIATRKSTQGFPFLSYMSMGLRLAALRVAGATDSLKKTKNTRHIYGLRTYLYAFVCSVFTASVTGSDNFTFDWKSRP